MEDAFDTLEKLIQEKVDGGFFPSVEHAVDSICLWLNEHEQKFIEEQMRSEDA